MSRIALVSAHYYPSYTRRSTRFAQTVASNLKADLCVLVANQETLFDPLSKAAESFPCAALVRQHDNVGLEFGAYQRGLDAALEAADVEWLVVINDTSSIHQSFGDARAANIGRHIAWRRHVDFPMAIGSIESIERSFQLAGLRTHRWITSNLFALNRPALKVLEFTFHCQGIEKMIRGGDDVDTFFSEDMDAPVRDHLSRWLFERGQAHHWYRARPLTPENSLAFARKAKAIVQELYMSARLESKSTAMVDAKHLPLWKRIPQRWLDRTVFRRRAV